MGAPSVPLPVALAAAALVALTALAGCGAPAGGGTSSPASSSPASSVSPPPPAPSVGGCRLLAHDVPARAEPNATFEVDVLPECGFQWTSEHVAAHYATQRSARADLADYPFACAIHAESAAGPHSKVACAIPTAGTYYLRAHARVPNGGQVQDLWSREFIVVVGGGASPPPGAPVVRAYDVPSTVHPGEAFPLNVTVEWGSVLGGHSSHMGAHTWASSQANPAVAGAGTCTHVTEDRPLPQRVETVCTAPAAGTLYLRGHARIENGGSLVDYWSDEAAVAVA